MKSKSALKQGIPTKKKIMNSQTKEEVEKLLSDFLGSERWDTVELLSIPGLKDRAWAQFTKLKEAGCIS